MATPAQISAWVNGYIQAWTTSNEADIAVIFADDALYYPRPNAEPWRGITRITSEWLDRKEYQVDWTFEWSTLLICDDTAVIDGTAVYGKGENARTFCNLWVVELAADGRSTSFREWIDIPAG
jgi:SnoaL-like domain